MMKTNEMVKAKMEVINMVDDQEGVKVILRVEEYENFVIEVDMFDEDGNHIADKEIEYEFQTWKAASMSANMLANKLAKEDFSEVEYAK